MLKRTFEVEMNPETLEINEKIETGKVVVLVLDGVKGKATKCEAVEHGFTIIETSKGKPVRIKFEDYELL
ncbi:hypothetical protein GCM10008967_00160 [Bacillus carboniphilus]|uniref:Terminase n=1 Tax=Bacillus carboniphilus TaxID=86663 RepID=A0ABN0VP03_9BACI